ncbi:MAG: YeeE/YedE family protein [Bacteroidia bacterium]|nr:YeeE/YedE family protein [Bacteroidia bacterium]
MKYLSFLIVGLVFGLTITKAEAVSWFRIQEMFQFQSIHMFGIIGSAVVFGVLLVALLRKLGVKNADGQLVGEAPKQPSVVRYLAGGTLFGLGWAFAGICPSMLFPLLGTGLPSYLVILGAMLLGTFSYGVVRDRLPH